MLKRIDAVFGLREHGTSLRFELIGGVTTFASMSYVLAVTATILANVGMDPEGVVAGCALAGALGCFIMALMTNYPIAVASAPGTNAYFAFVVVLGMGVPWQQALSITFWNGVIFLILAATGLRKRIAESLPVCIQIGIQVGIGFFVAYLGFQASGMVVDSASTLTIHGKVYQPSVLLCLVALVIMCILLARKFSAALIAGMIGVTLIGLVVPVTYGGVENITKIPESILVSPAAIGDVFLKLDLFWVFKDPMTAIIPLYTLLILDLFDSLGALTGVSRKANLLDENQKLPKMDKALKADACGTIVGSLCGAPTMTAFVESATGIEAGARTGLSTIFVGLCFLLAMFMAPLIAAIPTIATAPVLIVVGLLMAEGIRHLDFDDFIGSSSAVLIAIGMPLFFSIAHGIAIGLTYYLTMSLFMGKRREVPIMAWVTGGLFVLFFVFEYISDHAI